MLEADGDARYNTAVLIGPDGTYWANTASRSWAMNWCATRRATLRKFSTRPTAGWA